MSLPTPYYQEPGVTLYCADARYFEWRQLPGESVITDPVWPNSVFPDVADPQALLASVLRWAGGDTKRIVIHLGCDSDPRFLAAVPKAYPFFRACWLEYANPSYKGRLLYTGDVAYAFGEPPPSRKGGHVIPGKCLSTRSDKRFHRSTGRNKDKGIYATGDAWDALPHPCPRRLQHVRWLVKWFGGASVFDPFTGSGTTALACKEMGVPFVGVEIDEPSCELAVSRLTQSMLDLSEATA